MGANSLVTPTHIVPEWYLLPFYAILRSIPDKLGGVIAMGGAFVVLGLLPWITPKLVIKSSVFRPITRIFFWFIFVDFLLLGWIGQNVAEFPFIEIGQFLTLFYFSYFLFILPFLSYLEYRFCVRRRQGGCDVLYRKVNFNLSFTSKDNYQLVRSEYDPNRSSFIGLLYNYKDQQFPYILLPEGLAVNELILNSFENSFKRKPGFRSYLDYFPLGSLVHNIS